MECTVLRPSCLDLASLTEFDKVIISPGPGLPNNSEKLMQLVDASVGKKPLLGVCLGMQGIAEHFGAQLYCMDQVAHGIPLPCVVQDRVGPIFNGVPDQFEAGMYHSWAVKASSLPQELVCTAKSMDGVVMGVRHRELDVCGLQFHPESILTRHGRAMVRNWVLEQ